MLSAIPNNTPNYLNSILMDSNNTSLITNCNTTNNSYNNIEVEPKDSMGLNFENNGTNNNSFGGSYDGGGGNNSNAYNDNDRNEFVVNKISEKDTEAVSQQTPKRPLFVCSACEFAAANWVEFKHHRKIHSSIIAPAVKCSECKYTSSIKVAMEQHMMKHTGEKPFKCDHIECDYSTNFRGNMNLHMMRHTGEKPFECVLCDFTTTTKPKLTTHVRSWHVNRKWKNPRNKNKFKESQCESHDTMLQDIDLQENFDLKDQFECSLCDYISSSEKHIQEHSLICNGISDYGKTTPFVQETKPNIVKTEFRTDASKPLRENAKSCNISATSHSCLFTKNVELSESILHNQENKECHYYDKVDEMYEASHAEKNKVDVLVSESDEQTKYSNVDIVETRIAENKLVRKRRNKETRNLSELTEKMYSRKEIPQKTEIKTEVLEKNSCGKNILKETEVESELSERSVYLALSDIKKVKKEDKIENVNIYLPEGLNRNVVKWSTHRPGGSPCDAYHISPNSKKPLCVCSLCGFVAAKWMELKQHIKQHSNAVDVKCSECEYTSSSRVAMEQHMMKHTGEKPFRCKLIGCNYSTNFRGNMKCHTMVHTGDKPFECLKCEYRAVLKSNLKSHIRRKHRKEVFSSI
ncbi:unnamed protein product [Meganyctiphanes norvegica]|uniref:C2H2-type domain-containing protein n=1 Tax=Meganyctiphanes norvegica TaxID=48144 RepID=A0AAV2S735_MEGNR